MEYLDLYGWGEAFENGHLAYAVVCLGIEENGYVAYGRNASELVGSFSVVLALRRRDKGKPAARRGRIAYGPLVGR